MVIKVPIKYTGSKLNGVYIHELRVDETFGRIIVVAENNQRKEFYIKPENAELSADSILCEIQEKEGIEVLK